MSNDWFNQRGPQTPSEKDGALFPVGLNVWLYAVFLLRLSLIIIIFIFLPVLRFILCLEYHIFKPVSSHDF